MEKKYSHDLLHKLAERQTKRDYHGAEIIVKNLPDSDVLGEMDARLYEDMKAQLAMMSSMPKDAMKMDASPASIANLRMMFNAKKSIPVIDAPMKIENTSFARSSGGEIGIRIYHPDAPCTDSPVLLYIHGGGFFGGSMDVVDEAMKMIVANDGIPVVSVDYRLAPENPYPAGHEDCFEALKWLYENAHTIGASKDKIVVSGDSAGGNLTLYCATRDAELKTHMVRAQMLLYPTVNMGKVDDELVNFSIDKYEIAPEHKAAVEATLLGMGDSTSTLGDILGVSDVNTKYLTPYMADLSDMPPTLMTVGEHDFLAVECLAFSVKLVKAGVKTKTILYKGFGHAYIDNIGVYPQSEDCAIEMGKFIKESCN